MNTISYLLMSISSFVFWMAQVIRQQGKDKVIVDLDKFSALTCGFFVEKVEFEENSSFLCANSQIGFFYKDRIYEKEMLNRKATPEEVNSVFEYLANKIDECEELARKLNAIQRGLQDKQTI